MSDEDDIVLAELSDEDLVLQMHDDLYDGLKEEIEEGTTDSAWIAVGPQRECLGEALVDGMTIVGIDFRDGILFVPRCCCGQCHERWHGDSQAAAGRDRR